MNGSVIGPPPRRGLRDWLVDMGLFLFAAWLGLVLTGFRIESGVPVPEWLFEVDQVTGAVGCAALWLRRRWPVPLAVVLLLLSTFSELIAGAMLISLFTVAMHRTARTSIVLFVLGVLSASCYVVLRPEPDAPSLLLWAFGVAIQGAVVGWGMVVHHRRQLVLSLEERAVRAEAEAVLRAEQAQHQARDAIAREIHDVLGHRLSLLSVHAGALEYRPDASDGEVARAASVIRDNAHQALQDLREVIGVLRAPVGELPQPTLADIGALVEESRAAGTRIDLDEDVSGAVPDRTGRAAYRIVQEGLTNARKHAPGADVRVRVEGSAAQGLSIEVGNGRPPDAPPAASPAPGQGLVGVSERVSLAEGRWDHGPAEDGGWRLSAWLPWPT